MPDELVGERAAHVAQREGVAGVLEHDAVAAAQDVGEVLALVAAHARDIRVQSGLPTAVAGASGELDEQFGGVEGLGRGRRGRLLQAALQPGLPADVPQVAAHPVQIDRGTRDQEYAGSRLVHRVSDATRAPRWSPLDLCPMEVTASTEESGAIVAASDLRRRYGEGGAAIDALDGVSVTFPKGRFAAIMGPSGSGKSTLMHNLAGLDRPTSGSVTVDGVELTGLDDKRLTQLRRDRIGFIFQTFNLLPVLSAEENILLPLSIAGRKPDQAWLDRLIDTIGIRDRLSHRPAEMSGGQQQRVAVARALVSGPAVVFADEPTGNLDSKASGDVLELLRQAVDEFDQTVVMVTHDAHAASYADRLLVLADGRVVHDREAASTEEALDLMKSVG